MLKRLRELREAAGLGREKLAFAAGLSAQTIENLEKGQDCRVATAQKIAEALDVTIEDLMGEPTKAAS